MKEFWHETIPDNLRVNCILQINKIIQKTSFLGVKNSRLGCIIVYGWDQNKES
jgi:hypothetical protein